MRINEYPKHKQEEIRNEEKKRIDMILNLLGIALLFTITSVIFLTALGYNTIDLIMELFEIG